MNYTRDALNLMKEGLKGGTEREMKGNIRDNVATSALRASSHKLPHCFHEPNSWPDLQRDSLKKKKKFLFQHHRTYQTTNLFDLFRIFPVSPSCTLEHWSAAANWQHISSISCCLCHCVSKDLFWLERCPGKPRVQWKSVCVGLVNRDEGLCECHCFWTEHFRVLWQWSKEHLHLIHPVE